MKLPSGFVAWRGYVGRVIGSRPSGGESEVGEHLKKASEVWCIEYCFNYCVEANPDEVREVDVTPECSHEPGDKVNEEVSVCKTCRLWYTVATGHHIYNR
jgi:hypothetical protein